MAASRSARITMGSRPRDRAFGRGVRRAPRGRDLRDPRADEEEGGVAWGVIHGPSSERTGGDWHDPPSSWLPVQEILRRGGFGRDPVAALLADDSAERDEHDDRAATCDGDSAWLKIAHAPMVEITGLPSDSSDVSETSRCACAHVISPWPTTPGPSTSPRRATASRCRPCRRGRSTWRGTTASRTPRRRRTPTRSTTTCGRRGRDGASRSRKYPVNRTRLPTASRSPYTDEPSLLAPSTTTTAPASASAAKASSVRVRRSPNRRPATSRISAGCSAGINVALTIDVSRNDMKPNTIEAAKHTPVMNERLSSVHERRPPVMYAMLIMTGCAIHMRQNTTVFALALMPLTSSGPKPHAVTATATASNAVPVRRSSRFTRTRPSCCRTRGPGPRGARAPPARARSSRGRGPCARGRRPSRGADAHDVLVDDRALVELGGRRSARWRR